MLAAWNMMFCKAREAQLRPGLVPRLISAARLLAGVAVLCAIAPGCAPKEAASAPTDTQPPSNSAPAVAGVKADFVKLQGRWERPDGGYVMEIKSVDASGTINATYYNPDPIHISRAMAMEKDGATKVFVELQDANYPGCTYSLTYDPQSDQLYGQYYQAAMQETFDIVFARMK